MDAHDLGRENLPEPVRLERAPLLLAPSLPAPLTRLIGREREIGEAAALLREPSVRLVTLAGPGGVGKTRLAIELARELSNEVEDGAYFVDLTPVTNPDRMLSAIAAAIGLRHQDDANLPARLAAALRPRRIILVLDNFEQVIEAAPTMARLAAECPDLTLLVTSREALRVRGERVYPVTPLELPMNPADGGDGPAVRLFVERARAVDDRFIAEGEHGSAVAQICQRLDGLPLAIELAAARSSAIAPRELLARLDSGLSALRAVYRDAPDRQRTMHDAIGWSYDLLSPDEQSAFRRLSVFTGGFTIPAANWVIGNGSRLVDVSGASSPPATLPPRKETGDEPVPRDPSPETHSLIASLVAKSLLRQESSGQGGRRFGWLQTIREFALEQLAASGEEAAARAAHAAWCANLLAEAHPAFQTGRDESTWMNRLDIEMPNVRAAVHWLLDLGDGETVLQMIGPLDDYWVSRPYHAKVRSWLEAALTASPDVPSESRLLAVHLLVVVAAMLDDHDEALAQAEKAMRIADALGDPGARGRAHFYLAFALEHSGDGMTAADHYAAAIPLFRDADAGHWTALSMNEYADKLVWLGKPADAEPLLGDALALHREAGYTFGIAMASGQLGYAALGLGDTTRARTSFLESLDAARTISAARVELGAVAGLAAVSLAERDPARAARVLGAVEQAQLTAGEMRIAHVLHMERTVQRVQALLGEDGYRTEVEAGRLRSLDEAIALASARTAAPAELTATGPLSPREGEILQMLARGMSDRQMADALGIGVRTVESHVARICEKLGVRGRTAAVARATSAGLFRSPGSSGFRDR